MVLLPAVLTCSPSRSFRCSFSGYLALSRFSRGQAVSSCAFVGLLNYKKLISARSNTISLHFRNFGLCAGVARGGGVRLRRC
jgi:hypothetical protein